MTQSEIIGRLMKRGFNRGHRPLNDGSIVMSKRVKAWEQRFAQVSPDGEVNGGTLSEFLRTL
jgi:hypothetical protein